MNRRSRRWPWILTGSSKLWMNNRGTQRGPFKTVAHLSSFLSRLSPPRPLDCSVLSSQDLRCWPEPSLGSDLLPTEKIQIPQDNGARSVYLHG
ncbi:hypothetical protein FKM82_012169 [Ascaphus truei]